MATSSSNVPDPEEEYYVPWTTALLFFGAAVLGGAVMVALLPTWVPALQDSLGGPTPHAFWYLARTSGLVAYGLAWMSMAFGVLISNKLARVWPGGPTAFALHEYTSLLALAFAAGHAIFLLGDHYIGYTLPQILIPFGNPDYRTLGVGIGQIAFYGLIAVTVTFYLRRRLGQRTWRVIHRLSYGFFVLALVHGVVAGTDSTGLWVQAYYWLSTLALAGLTIYRLREMRTAQAAGAARRGSPRRAA